jgi:hypothetical protein
METKEKTHWKVLQHPDYIGAYALMKGDTNIELNVKIESVRREIVTGPDGKKEECTIMTIPPHKPMILNATNQKNLTKAISSPFIEDWGGKVVTLYVAKVKAFGDTVDALRIKDKLPDLKKPEFTPEHKKWAGAIQAIKDKTNTVDSTIESIKKSFDLSPAHEKLIKDAAL